MLKKKELIKLLLCAQKKKMSFKNCVIWSDVNKDHNAGAKWGGANLSHGVAFQLLRSSQW